MKKNWISAVTALSLFVSLSLPARPSAAAAPGIEEIVLVQQSKKVVHNGVASTSPQPLTMKNGVTYVAAKALMKELSGSISFDAKTKVYKLNFSKQTMTFTVGKTTYTLDGKAKSGAQGAPYVLNGTLMVPIRTVANGFGLSLITAQGGKQLTLSWSMKPIAKFEVSNLKPYAEQSEVSYKDLSYHPRGYKIVAERWENNYSMFEQAGAVKVTHWVQDEAGLWSEPYTVTINVKPPNQPPVADFSTDKDVYKMGELIHYEDVSTDDENWITNRKWTNKQKGFFTPGPQTITLVVTDAHGETSEISKTITISDATLYPEESFHLLYTDIGDKFPLPGKDVLNYSLIPYDIMNQGVTLVRSNSPETIVDEGIYYADQVAGNVRFMTHNANGRDVPVKIYIVATNNNATDATAKIGPVGIGGPNLYVPNVARSVSAKYLDARLNPKSSTVSIPAGQTRILVPAVSDKTLDPGDVYASLADVFLDQPLDIKVVVVNADRNVFATLPSLSVLPVVAHVRGTFDDANRMMIVNRTIGDVKGRMVLADNSIDTRLSGIDKTTDTPVLNSGNYGAVYTIRMNMVQPHTAIVVNGRGGYYAGAFLVNGKLVYATNTGYLQNNNEGAMLYRTGDSIESVTIQFTPAPGSNLPINLLFYPEPPGAIPDPEPATEPPLENIEP
ncbi:copper amine oxidase N-terminal domain-containing protein [Cohnella soli]|uniref:Copper amine oxidase N-terminal domain-containing protein n=1 Tax=Cohnella soli TaxID=425005 RepID=A0ABW0I2V8_9BACL